MAWYRILMVAPVVGLLLLSAWTDLATRTIPDSVAAAVAVFGAAVRLSDGASALAWSVAVAALVFLLLAILHARGLLGGGDAKLAAATCLGLSPIAAYQFIFSTTMAGGMLALLHLVLRRSVRGTKPWPPPCRGTALPRRMVCAERWRIARHGSLPYAVAIACGGLWVILTGNGG